MRRRIDLAVQSGVYAIRNQVNGKQYIGSAVNLEGRWRAHLRALRKGIHHNRYLQRAFRKNGEDVFEFVVLEVVEDCLMLISREQFYIDSAGPELRYNLSPTAGSRLGCRASSKTRHKMSTARSGKRNPNYGKPLSESHRRAVGEANRHRHYSVEKRRRMSETASKCQSSREYRQRRSDAMMGTRNPMYGRHHSAATKQKIREAALERWAQRKRAALPW